MAAPQLLARIVGAVLKETVMLAFIYTDHETSPDYMAVLAGKWESGGSIEYFFYFYFSFSCLQMNYLLAPA